MLKGQEATSLQLYPLPSLGDVGSFVVKLVEGLKGQTWASDWTEELRQADRQKEQAFRWGLGRVDAGAGGVVVGSWKALLLAWLTCAAPWQGEGTDACSPASEPSAGTAASGGNSARQLDSGG